jgi:hypothetical protein
MSFRQLNRSTSASYHVLPRICCHIIKLHIIVRYGPSGRIRLREAPENVNNVTKSMISTRESPSECLVRWSLKKQTEAYPNLALYSKK